MEDFTTNRDAFGYDDEPTPPDRWLAWLTVAAFVVVFVGFFAAVLT